MKLKNRLCIVKNVRIIAEKKFVKSVWISMSKMCFVCLTKLCKTIRLIGKWIETICIGRIFKMDIFALLRIDYIRFYDNVNETKVEIIYVFSKITAILYKNCANVEIVDVRLFFFFFSFCWRSLIMACNSIPVKSRIQIELQ